MVCRKMAWFVDFILQYSHYLQSICNVISYYYYASLVTQNTSSPFKTSKMNCRMASVARRDGCHARTPGHGQESGPIPPPLPPLSQPMRWEHEVKNRMGN